MTGKEALAGVQELSRHFNKPYKGGELNRVWGELLGCSHAAFVRAVGIAKKNLRYLPDVDYILEQTKWWHMNLRYQVESSVRLATDQNDREGCDSFSFPRMVVGGVFPGGD